MGIDLSGYVEVKDRIAEFKEKYPDGRLVSEIVATEHPGFIAVKAYAYRTPDDAVPGVGLAWEPVPGKTTFTKDSELQNAETSAWGRALVAALIADASTGVASANEVRNRQAPAASGEGTGGSSAGPTPSYLDDDYVCPACGSPVQNNLAEHFKDKKKPAFRCGNRACQGGGAKKDGGNWPWATWEQNFFKQEDEDPDAELIRRDFDPETGERLWPPGMEPFE